MIYSFILFSTLFLANIFAPEEAAPFPTNLNENIGLQGNGFSDVYGGKVKEGVYGAGGRVGGGLNLLGTTGLGREKRWSITTNANANANGPNSKATTKFGGVNIPATAFGAHSADDRKSP